MCVRPHTSLSVFLSLSVCVRACVHLIVCISESNIVKEIINMRKRSRGAENAVISGNGRLSG